LASSVLASPSEIVLSVASSLFVLFRSVCFHHHFVWTLYVSDARFIYIIYSSLPLPLFVPHYHWSFIVASIAFHCSSLIFCHSSQSNTLVSELLLPPPFLPHILPFISLFFDTIPVLLTLFNSAFQFIRQFAVRSPFIVSFYLCASSYRSWQIFASSPEKNTTLVHMP